MALIVDVWILRRRPAGGHGAGDHRPAGVWRSCVGCQTESALPEEAMSLDFDVFVVDPKPIPSALPAFDAAVGPATWPPSTSTLISADDGALLVDCLITEQEGQDLAAWVASHDRDPG